MMLLFCKIHLKGYNLIIEQNLFQIGVQSFQYSYQYQGQQNVILYPVYDMLLDVSFYYILSTDFQV